MTLLRRLESSFEEAFLIASLIVMVLLIFTQVVLRAFHMSIVWIEELARYIMLYQIWIGAAYAVKESAHIRITSFRDRLPVEKKRRLEILVMAIFLVFSLWLSIRGIQLCHTQAHIGQRSPALQLPMVIPYASVPLGGILMSLRLLQRLDHLLKGEVF